MGSGVVFRRIVLGIGVSIFLMQGFCVQAEDGDKEGIVVLYSPDKGMEIKAFAEEKGDNMLQDTAVSEDLAVAVIEIETEGILAEEAAASYKEQEQVIAASPNYELELYGTPAVNDPDYTQQTFLHQVSAIQAWKRLSAVPHSKVLVAVLDTGAETEHPDLVNVLNRSLSSEILSEDGKVGPLLGDGYVNGIDAGYTKSHGTHVSGILAAEANNGQGIAGVGSAGDNSVVDLMVVDVFNKEKTTNLAYLIQGMEYARKCGAKIINLSLGIRRDTGIDDSVLYVECQRLYEAGVIVVCASGNHGLSDNGNISVVPADYDNTIGVISVDGDNRRQGFSNYGGRKDLSAPGGNIYSTMQNGNYGRLSGTSMAAPSVTAAAAMLCSVNPTLTTVSVRDILLKNATDIGAPGKDPETAGGLLNMRRSLEAVIPEENILIQLPYSDVSEADWFYDDAACLYLYEMMTGLTETRFGPAEQICRAQAATILYRYAGEPAVTYRGYFPDVAKGQFYTDAVEWAASNGIITGYEDSGLFGPADPVTREQLAVLLYRFASGQNYVALEEGSLESFPDGNRVNAFAAGAMRWGVGTGIIRGYGDGSLSPQNTAERAVCAAMIRRFMERY